MGETLDPQQAFAAAMASHQRGALADAENSYRAILHAAPTHFGAIYLLGVVFLQQGRYEAAERQLDLALKANPAVASAHEHYGEALLNLTRPQEALASFDRALALKPDFAEAHGNRGVALARLGQRPEALASYDAALALKPNYAAAWIGRGAVLQESGRSEEALESYDRAIALLPHSAEAFSNRGNTLCTLRRFDEALASFDRAIALKPDYAEAYYNRGLVLAEIERFAEALACYERAIALKPDYAEAHDNRGNALLALNRPQEALANYEKAIALKPDFAEAIDNRGRCKLLLGRFADGWADYEQRWRKPRFASVRPPCEAPHWKGESIAGRSILVYFEQGLGDAIQFSRYLQLLAERGANVSFMAPPQLVRLLKTLPVPVRFVTALTREDRFDLQCPLMSLPHLMGVELAPMEGPYLSPDSERVTFWRARLAGGGFKIGICWQANPIGLGRSFPLAALFPLSQMPGVRLIALQKNYGLGQLDTRPNGMAVETLGDFDEGDAFLDSAAIMASLDLVLTCDTSVAHLAGALNRPVWVALKDVPDWRWMLLRDDSPWYPSMRLFRQHRAGDWTGAFADIEAALEEMRH
jgi:tetratricopeptide (TPR) repeat protein